MIKNPVCRRSETRGLKPTANHNRSLRDDSVCRTRSQPSPIHPRIDSPNFAMNRFCPIKPNSQEISYG
jgi:hypothetical protein